MSKKRKKVNGGTTMPERLFIVKEKDTNGEFDFPPYGDVYDAAVSAEAHAVIGKTVRVAEYQLIGYSDVKTEPTVEVVT